MYTQFAYVGKMNLLNDFLTKIQLSCFGTLCTYIVKMRASRFKYKKKVSLLKVNKLAGYLYIDVPVMKGCKSFFQL